MEELLLDHSPEISPDKQNGWKSRITSIESTVRNYSFDLRNKAEAVRPQEAQQASSAHVSSLLQASVAQNQSESL